MVSPKNKLRLCLIFVVLLVVFVGTMYYMFGDEQEEHLGQSTLVKVIYWE